MHSDTAPHIQQADRVRDGVVVTFSDGVTVLFSTGFLFTERDRDVNTRLAILHDDY